jgi:hypothetical protein
LSDTFSEDEEQQEKQGSDDDDDDDSGDEGLHATKADLAVQETLLHVYSRRPRDSQAGLSLAIGPSTLAPP